MDTLQVIKHTVGFFFFAGVISSGWAQDLESGPLVDTVGEQQPAENTQIASDILLMAAANLEAGVHTIKAKAAIAAENTIEDTISFIIVEPSAADLADTETDSDLVYLAER